MIIKVYIKRHMFQLPRKQEDLTELVRERLYKNKTLVKSAITKLYPISKIENENIKVERNTNIFLLNLYLLVLQEKGELTITEKISLNDEILLQKIDEITNLNVSNVSLDDAEQMILNYLYPKETIVEKEDTGDTGDTKDTFNDIQYSIDWIKKAHNELNK